MCTKTSPPSWPASQSSLPPPRRCTRRLRLPLRPIFRRASCLRRSAWSRGRWTGPSPRPLTMTRRSSSATTSTRMPRGAERSATTPSTVPGFPGSTLCVASCTRMGGSSVVRCPPPVHLPVRAGCCRRWRRRVADPLPDRVAHAW
nr:MAG TPA: hypothetical protein [Caudoviricetes sp.]